MGINKKDYEEWKEKASKEKTEISVTDLIKVCSRIASVASVAAEPKSKAVGMLNASMETVKIIDEFFPEKKEEEPDAEKSAEKTALSALEELLFEQTHLAVEQYAAESSSEAYSRFEALYGLVRDSGLETRYFAWKEEKGYE